MHKRIKFYIGADNVTGKRDEDKACQIVGREYVGFTIMLSAGVWNDKKESSMVIEAIEKDNFLSLKRARRVAELLKLELKQESILVTIDTIGEVLYV